jgi:hypothetical protein
MGMGLQIFLGALLALAPATSAPVPTPSPAASPSPAVSQSATRRLLVLNEGNEAIFSLRIGEPAAKNNETWSDDLLSFDRVIDVSEAQELDIALDPSTCRYDIQATYRDNHTVIQHNINLCHTQRITFTH